MAAATIRAPVPSASGWARRISRKGAFPAPQALRMERLLLAAVAAFSLFPITIRYGRAFQPDAMMLGTLLAGLHCWDEQESGRGRAWLAAGWLLLALGLALKIISAYVLIPLCLAILGPPRG